jgi:hypothetical protein
VPEADSREAFEFAASEDTADRVVRVTQNEDARAGGDGRLERVEIDFVLPVDYRLYMKKAPASSASVAGLVILGKRRPRCRPLTRRAAATCLPPSWSRES